MTSACVSLLAGCMSSSQLEEATSIGGHDLARNALGNRVLESLEGYWGSSYEVGAEGGLVIPEWPSLGSLRVEAPLDLALNDNLIHICMNRLGPPSCDYLMNTPQPSVKLPLKGSISVSSSHVFDEAVITQIRDDLNMGVPRPDAGYLQLVLTNVGSGCDVTDGNTLVAGMAQFWNNVSLSPDKKTFSWNLTNANAAVFEDSCSQTQAQVNLTLRIGLPLVSAGTQYRSSITLSNDPLVMRPEYAWKRIIITNN
ncbi:hypothetical protein HUA74_10050 [Myxococcus sp. CA051A]|uniref:hypothetical protein n=1 Tax=Myxococcus sp. CA051A TaxID=2741739 RepID=UPI00157B21BE|nr:hypothetical protein [Myxococcus sp. CA051A]NTX61002.1 hypothetical protein [Myxococcus sp. CA051A]